MACDVGWGRYFKRVETVESRSDTCDSRRGAVSWSALESANHDGRIIATEGE
jgi:hypothetical protein